MPIDEKKLARQMRAAEERSRRERRGKLAEKALGMQEIRAGHKRIGRPSRSDVERSIGYTVCNALGALPAAQAIRSRMETGILDLLAQAGFNRSQAGHVLQHMIETAQDCQERWLLRRDTDRRLAQLLAD